MVKAFSVFTVLILNFCPLVLTGQTGTGQNTKMESSGDSAGARTALAQAVQTAPNSIPALTRYAEFLERHADPGAREAYQHLASALKSSGDSAAAASVAHRLAILDLLAGDRESAEKETGHGIGAAKTDSARPTIAIPGPIRPFARMAAIAPDALPDEVLPALARNVVTNGYEASHSNEALEQTEYLKLVHRYLSQARELDKLAGEDKIIKIESLRFAEGGRTDSGARLPHARAGAGPNWCWKR